MSEMKDMWRCPTPNCGYVYDPDRGDRRHHIPKGTKFEDLPDDWVWPVCGASKKNFHRLWEKAAFGLPFLFCTPVVGVSRGEKSESGKKKYLRAG